MWTGKVTKGSSSGLLALMTVTHQTRNHSALTVARERKKKQCVTITKESSLSGADDESSFSCELGGILTWVVLKESLRGFLCSLIVGLLCWMLFCCSLMIHLSAFNIIFFSFVFQFLTLCPQA